MHWTDRRQKFRAVLNGDICVHPGSVHDPISARIAEDLGFELGMFAGSIGSFTVLGVPDIIVMTLTEFAAQAYRINRAGNLPRPFNEPKPVMLSIAEGIGKMRAAVAGRQDSLLSIFARTSAPAISGTADTIERVKAYSQTGVDAIFLVGVKDRAQLDAISEHTHLPIMMGGLQGDLADKEYLASRKVRIALQGHQPFSAAVQAIYNTLKALREGTAPKDLTGIASAALMKQVTREATYDAWTQQFLDG